jgi:membrane-bound inhibitor of C-type lysozyme
MKAIRFCVFSISVALTIASVPAIAQQRVYTYECANGKSFQAQYSTNSATVRVNDQSLTLPAVAADPGTARYSDGRYLLFTKSNNTEAFVEVNGDRTHDGCIAQDGSSPSTSSTGSTSTTTPVRGLW